MPQEYTDILVEQQRRWRKTLALTAGIVTLVIGFSFYTGLFDPQRLSEGIPSVISLMAEGSPPDFSTAGTWLKPLFDTLAMSIAGTAIAVFSRCHWDCLPPETPPRIQSSIRWPAPS